MAARTATPNPSAAEALSLNIPFSYGGVDYLVAPTTEWEYSVLEAYEEGRIAGFLKGVLGAEQHDKFKATRPKVTAVRDFVVALQKALGIAGN